jgi:hypothetical protein
MAVTINGSAPDAGQKAAVAAAFGLAINTEVATFADLPAAGSVVVGRTYTVLGAICTGGATGTRWQSSGTIWRPAGGQVLWHTQVPVDGVSGGTTSEQILASPLFPAGVFAGVRLLRLRSRWTSSGADAAARTMRWRIGSAGTTSDDAVQTWSAAAATARVILFASDQSVPSATGLQSSMFPTVYAAIDSNFGTSGSPPAPTTVPNMGSTALYASVSVQQGASPTATMTLTGAWVYVE